MEVSLHERFMHQNEAFSFEKQATNFLALGENKDKGDIKRVSTRK